MPKCSICTGPFHPTTGHIPSTKTFVCGACAKDFWAWLKARMASMASKRKGEATSFADAAATSIHPENIVK